MQSPLTVLVSAMFSLPLGECPVRGRVRAVAASPQPLTAPPRFPPPCGQTLISLVRCEPSRFNSGGRRLRNDLSEAFRNPICDQIFVATAQRLWRPIPQRLTHAPATLLRWPPPLGARLSPAFSTTVLAPPRYSVQPAQDFAHFL